MASHAGVLFPWTFQILSVNFKLNFNLIWNKKGTENIYIYKTSLTCAGQTSRLRNGFGFEFVKIPNRYDMIVTNKYQNRSIM
jgi:hypothetical protein